MLDALFAFVGVFSLDGVVLDTNRAPLLASGLTHDDVIDRRFVDLPWFAHSREERDRVADAIAHAARGETIRGDICVQRVRGGMMWVDACFAPLRDAGGTVVRVVASGVDVTERKRAEEHLAHSEARLKEAQRVAHIGSWEWDIARDRVTWSDEMFRVYRLSPAAFDGRYQGFLAHVHPEDLEHTRSVVTAALRNVTPFVYDHRILCGDGAIRMLHTRGEVVADDLGRPVRMTGSCWDITDRWQAEQDRERSMSLLRAALEATIDGVLVVDREGKVQAFNQPFLALWRIPRELAAAGDDDALLAYVHDQLVAPEEFIARVHELYHRPEIEAFDVIRCKDGRVFERCSRPQRLQREIVGRVWSFRDVTHRERLLDAAQTARRAAERAHYVLAAVLERISDGVVALDRSWRFVYVNECGARMLDRDPRSLLGKVFWDEFPEARGHRQEFERALAEQQPRQFRDSAHAGRWFEKRLYPSPEGLSIFFNDITNQVHTERRLRDSADQLRTLAARLERVRDDERRVMAREIHDQIGQALTGLKLEVGWLQRHAGALDEDGARRRLAAMSDLIDGTLETARRLSSALRPAMLDDLGLAAATEWQAQDLQARTGIEVDLDLPADGSENIPSPIALALFRILQEALTNVARHAGARHVAIRLAVERDAVVLTVSDDGRGITSEQAERDDSLGLLGMRERALVFGGQVTVEGNHGSGTTVTARMPLRREAA